MQTVEQDKPKLIGQYFCEKGLVNQQQIDVALQEQIITGERLGEILIRFGFFGREYLVEALAHLNPEALVGEKSVQVEIPPEVLLEHKSMVVGDTGSVLYLATLHAKPQQVVERLSSYLAGKRELVLVPIRHAVITAHLSALERGLRSARLGHDDLDINVQIGQLIHRALEDSASDIHIETSEKSLHIRYRIDGILHVVKVLPDTVTSKMFSRIKDMSGMNISDKMVPQDGSFSLSYRGRNVDFRVSTIPSSFGEKATIRILDKEKMMVGVRNIGISRIDDWLDLSRQTTGLILVCGPTGSGKTTTLYATLREINLLEKGVYSIEDPVEYRVPFVTQVQVNRSAKLDFAAFTRTVLRHDPDVVVVGEIRDGETAENALWLADTGHLVYATLHTNDIPSTILRLTDLGAELPKLSFALRGILVQKLVRKLCVECGGSGCKNCKDTGYRGRTLLTEFARLDNHRDIYRLIDPPENAPPLYHHIIDDARLKLEGGITDCAEIERVLGIRVTGAWCGGCDRKDGCPSAVGIGM
jgi:type II secretory ATPase GspE/PulE/Tfp pilus assembly ATPase PilB-like protein